MNPVPDDWQFSVMLIVCFWHTQVVLCLSSGRPDPPMDLDLSDPAARSVRLTWIPGNDNRSPVTGNLSVFTPVPSPGSWSCSFKGSVCSTVEPWNVVFLCRVLGPVWRESLGTRPMAGPVHLPRRPELCHPAARPLRQLPVQGHRHKLSGSEFAQQTFSTVQNQRST